MIGKEQLVTVNLNDSIISVMRSMNDAGSSLAIIIDKDERLVGIVTDGDIRRGFIDGHSKNKSIETIMNSSPTVVKHNMNTETMNRLINDSFKCIPVLDDNDRVQGILNYQDKSIMLDVKSRNVCVLGMGYVGLTLSLMLAESGFTVYGFDVNKSLIDKINSGEASFHEDGIDAYLQRHCNKNLIATTELNTIQADTYIVTVGTPIDLETHLPRIEYIKQAIGTIAPILKRNDLLILRSTVPVGTTRNVVLPILDEMSNLVAGKDYYLAYAPERTVEGKALQEIKELPQVIGGYNEKSRVMTELLFRELTSTIIDVGTLESAEMIKIMNNTYRDVKFAYANEMALICKDLGLDMVKLVHAANMGYVRDKIPVPSPGVGGACLSKDSYILMYSSKDIKYSPEIVERSRKLNEKIPLDIAQEVKRTLSIIDKLGKPIKVFIIGFAFKGKPETSDMRGSTTLDILEYLKKENVISDTVFGYDPIVSQTDIEDIGVKFVSLETGFESADVVLILNNHGSYINMDIFSLLESAQSDCIFVDGWHLFEPEDITRINDIKYIGVGCKY